MDDEGELKATAVWRGQNIRETLSLIDASIHGAIVFLDAGGRVAGLVTDGDIRRALIRGAELSDPIAVAWTSQPVTVSIRTPISERYQILQARHLRHLVVVDEDGMFADLQLIEDVEALNEINPRRCPVVLMAGGRGQRLMPFTSNCPKPMLEIGGKPLLERTLRMLIEQGFEDFFISVRYLKEQIIDYFGDGGRFGVRIRYLSEDDACGTGGCLKLLPKLENRHVLVSNGDLITDLDFRSLLIFADSQKLAATMVVREVSTQVRYGVVRVEGPTFLRLDEKPVHSYFINAGIYALRTHTLDSLPGASAFDMPDLFAKLTAEGQECGVFEHKGEWVDIGTPDQLQEARRAIELADEPYVE